MDTVDELTVHYVCQRVVPYYSTTFNSTLLENETVTYKERLILSVGRWQKYFVKPIQNATTQLVLL